MRRMTMTINYSRGLPRRKTSSSKFETHNCPYPGSALYLTMMVRGREWVLMSRLRKRKPALLGW
jgi:hypothetical protein